MAGDCPGLLGHRAAEIVSSLGDPAPQEGLLPKWRCRVKVNSGEWGFTFTLTRQSGFDGGDARDCDGFERCWFVWEIRPSDGGGGSVVVEPVPTPTPREPVPT